MEAAMTVLALDPGSENSAYVLLDATGRVLDHGLFANEIVLGVVRDSGADVLAVEMIASYGMAVGASVFTTCVWIGRFVQEWAPRPHALVYRRAVKMHLCGNARAKDANVRQALLDLYGDGTRQTACGVKSKPGPLYGIKKDEWAALAVGVTYQAGVNNKTLLKQIADLEALARKAG
jgi:hypothetical protein